MIALVVRERERERERRGEYVVGMGTDTNVCMRYVCLGPTTPSSTAKKRKGTASGSDVEDTPSKKPKAKKESVAMSKPKSEPGSPKSVLDGFPEDAEEFIKSEEQWEADFI